MATINWSLQHKRDTAANWTANNPTLLAGQIGIETDNLTTTPKFKIGNGTTAWNTLPYANGTGIFQPLATNLTSLSGLTYASTSFVKMTAAGTFALDTTTYLTTISGLNISLLNNDSGYITSSALSPYLTSANAALTYQPLDSDLTSWAGVTRASGFDTFVATPSSANLSSLLTDKTGSGVNVFGTSPTFTTNITTPIVYGSSSASGTLTIDSTSNATKGAIIFGTASSENVYNFNVGSSSALVRISGRVGATSQAAIYFNQSSPAVGNAALYGLNTTTILNCTGGGTVNIANGGTTLAAYTNTSITWTPLAVSSGATTSIVFTLPSNTGQTASTEIPNFRVNGATKTWSAGNITTQRWNYFTANTAAFASASTISESIALAVEAATAGSNATITNNFALGLTAGTATVKIGNLTGTTDSSAIYLNQATPSSSNYIIRSDSSGNSFFNGAVNGGNVTFQAFGTTWMIGNSNRIRFTPAASTAGAVNTFTFTNPASTGQTASTEINGLIYNGGSRQWLSGAITTQRELYCSSTTYSFTSPSTITNAYGAYFEAPTAGSNCTITNNWSAGFSGSVEIINGRLVRNQGADVASANNLVLGTDGNVFEITGTTQINLISNIGWKNGAMITLLFTSTPTVKHNQATSTTNITIQLAGAADFVATAGDTLTLVLSEIGGTQAWREVSRAVI